MTQDLLFEVGTEELPPKIINKLAAHLADNLCEQLTEANLNFTQVSIFSTPRRIAVIITELSTKQADHALEKKGPAIQAAFDAENNPTQAALGFAKSCGITINALQRKRINNGEFLVYEQQVSGKQTVSLLPHICETALKKLPIPKPMRWGTGLHAFIRPIHWIVLLFGNELINAQIFGVPTQRETYGHRFHHPQTISLKHADNYQALLHSPGYVIANFETRRQLIHDQIHAIANDMNAIAVIDRHLLDEVTGLVEWPVALLAKFDEAFLQIPEEVLISAMQTHQKAFHLVNAQGKLLPHFIAVANIKSINPQKVIAGNERVMRARLADAAFFYKTDCKHSSESRLERLKGIVFQAKLGDLYERAVRIANLSAAIAEKINADPNIAEKAALLAKTDLVADMVQEFPELQGVMGYYYALNDHLSNDIAMGIRDHYMPRFAGDSLPETHYSCCVSLADRFDKLVGIFGIAQAPTGEKDPFALRRAALGALQIIIEKSLPIDISFLIAKAIENYQGILPNKQTAETLQNFFFERLKNWYQEKDISVDVFNAVYARNITSPYDFHLRIHAVKTFRDLPEAQSLAAANKRVSNILIKENITNGYHSINENLLELSAEKELVKLIKEKENQISPLIKSNDYTGLLKNLASLQQPIDRFFDEVMVMVDDENLRNNRLALLVNLRNLFLRVADISKLQGSS